MNDDSNDKYDEETVNQDMKLCVWKEWTKGSYAYYLSEIVSIAPLQGLWRVFQLS